MHKLASVYNPLATWLMPASSHPGLLQYPEHAICSLSYLDLRIALLKYPLCFTKVTFQPGLHFPKVTNLDSLLPSSWGSSFSPVKDPVTGQRSLKILLLLPGSPHAQHLQIVFQQFYSLSKPPTCLWAPWDLGPVSPTYCWSSVPSWFQHRVGTWFHK